MRLIGALRRWRLAVDGLVERPLVLDDAALAGLPAREVAAVIECFAISTPAPRVRPRMRPSARFTEILEHRLPQHPAPRALKRRLAAQWPTSARARRSRWRRRPPWLAPAAATALLFDLPGAP
ncbi:MAG TPA: hypothetical protein VNN07_12245 [Candidatus Tectomicrobia bacterium]|nr:hypothetical protein [Candidatus Tectomicrobia bacterium]